MADSLPPPRVPELVWETIRDLGGRCAVQELVLAMISELATEWDRSGDATRSRCAASLKLRLALLNKGEP